MKKTGFLHDERYQLHNTGAFHPEMPQRLKAIYKGIKDADILRKISLIPAVPADQGWIETVHDFNYIMRFEEACLSGMTDFDCPDNIMGPETYDVAMLATGGIIDVAARLMKGEIDNAFCAVRPPGHHAEKNEAMGFCYFNNIAIVARYLQQKWGIARVGIVDFDVHHGNGTQHIFEQDPTVFYYSIHQHPSFSYPGTGREFEEGTLAGLGFTKNSPVLPGRADLEYKRLMERDLFPAFDAFKPQVILVSAGFDAHKDDDMSDIRLTTQAFVWIMERIVEMADKYCDGRVISLLEGGYAIKRLPELARDHMTVLMNG